MWNAPRDIPHELHSFVFYVPRGLWYMPHTVWSVAPNILGPHSDTILAIGPWPLLGAEDKISYFLLLDLIKKHQL